MWGIKNNLEIIETEFGSSYEMGDMCNKLDIYNENTESESVEEPDNEESIYIASTST